MSKDTPVPPGLGAAGARLWVDANRDYDFRVDELVTLENACRALDRIVEMRDLQATQPTVVVGSMGQPVVHPLVAEIRAHEARVEAALKSLKIPDLESGAGETNQNREAGSAKWKTSHGKAS